MRSFARALAVAIVVLVVLELTSRAIAMLRNVPPPETRQLLGDVHADPGVETLASVKSLGVVLAADDELIWRNRPNVSLDLPVTPTSVGAPPAWSLHTDANGMRSTLPPPVAGSSVRRVLCLGDSVTFGINVSDAETWPARLEADLRTKFPTAQFEVLNAAVPGWSWVQGARFLVREGFSYRPDIVLAAFGTANQYRPVTITDSERFWLARQPVIGAWMSIRSALLHSYAFTLLEEWMSKGNDAIEPSPGCRQSAILPGNCRRVGAPEIESAIRGFAEVSRAAGVDLALVNLDFLATPAAQAMSRAATREKIPFLDVALQLERDRVFMQAAETRKLRLADPRVPVVPRIRGDATQPFESPSTIRIRVRGVPGAAVSVRGRCEPDRTFPFDRAMNDAAVDGDEIAGDGVHTTLLTVPGACAGIRYQYVSDGKAEFGDAPADFIDYDRAVPFNRNSDAPVETFGARVNMSDASHPDARGHAAIATRILTLLEQLPAFRTAAGLEPIAGQPRQ